MEGASEVKAEHPPVEARMENVVAPDSKRPLHQPYAFATFVEEEGGMRRRRGHVSKPGDECRELGEMSEDENKQEGGKMGGSRVFGQRKK